MFSSGQIEPMNHRKINGLQTWYQPVFLCGKVCSIPTLTFERGFHSERFSPRKRAHFVRNRICAWSAPLPITTVSSPNKSQVKHVRMQTEETAFQSRTMASPYLIHEALSALAVDPRGNCDAILFPALSFYTLLPKKVEFPTTPMGKRSIPRTKSAAGCRHGKPRALNLKSVRCSSSSSSNRIRRRHRRRKRLCLLGKRTAREALALRREVYHENAVDDDRPTDDSTISQQQ